MGAGTKILAGCGCLTIVAAAALVAGVGLGVFRVRGALDRLAGRVDTLPAAFAEIEAWEKKANAHPWDRRPHGVIPEGRLLKFLEVRRRVNVLYERHKADIEALARRSKPSNGGVLRPSEILALGGRTARMFVDLRLAQLRALDQEGMSEPEYRSIQLAVYKAAGAWKSAEQTGRMPAQAVSEATRRVQGAVRSGLEKAREEGLPGAKRVSDSDIESLEKTLGEVGTSGAQALAVPPENVNLFRKHEDEIERYAMHGLALLGL
jgi:hypothetical protein